MCLRDVCSREIEVPPAEASWGLASCCGTCVAAKLKYHRLKPGGGQNQDQGSRTSINHWSVEMLIVFPGRPWLRTFQPTYHRRCIVEGSKFADFSVTQCA